MDTCYLKKALERNSLHHALVLSGSEKEEIARTLARELLQTEKEEHPDLHLYRPEGKSETHSIEAMRSLIEEVHKPPFEAKRKVFILFEAERIPPLAAHALLKTVEEPELDSTIIFLTNAPQELLPTLRSRCIEFVVHNKDPSLAVTQTEQLFCDALEERIPLFQFREAIEELSREDEERLLTTYLTWARKEEMQKERTTGLKRQAPSLTEAHLRAIRVKSALDRNIPFVACLPLLFKSSDGSE